MFVTRTGHSDRAGVCGCRRDVGRTCFKREARLPEPALCLSHLQGTPPCLCFYARTTTTPCRRWIALVSSSTCAPAVVGSGWIAVNWKADGSQRSRLGPSARRGALRAPAPAACLTLGRRSLRAWRAWRARIRRTLRARRIRLRRLAQAARVHLRYLRLSTLAQAAFISRIVRERHKFHPVEAGWLSTTPSRPSCPSSGR